LCRRIIINNNSNFIKIAGSFGLAFTLIFAPALIMEPENRPAERYSSDSSAQANSAHYNTYALSVRLLERIEILNSEVIAENNLLNIASESKNIEPFQNTNSRNAANRFKEWKRSDRTVEENSPRHYALTKFEDYGWQVKKEWGCLDRLWWHESNWSHTAGDATGKGAYGIPQAAPGNKMSAEGDDWKTSPETQIDWGLNYIENRYGSPCKAFKFWKKQAEYGDKGYGWY
jgi:hypothetical protein